jgi:hypothetical protein
MSDSLYATGRRAIRHSSEIFQCYGDVRGREDVNSARVYRGLMQTWEARMSEKELVTKKVRRTLVTDVYVAVSRPPDSHR